MSMTPEDSLKFAAQIAARNNLDKDTADDYAARIGDTPETDEEGLLIVRNDKGDIIARLT